MKALTLATIMLVFTIMAWQDFRGRYVNLYVLILFGCLLIPFHFFIKELQWTDSLLNLAYLMILWGLTALILKLRGKTFNSAIGQGDLLFLLIGTGYFTFPNFIIWLNIALISALIIHLILSALIRKYREQQLIPLLGLLAIVLAPAIIIEQFWSPFNHIFFQQLLK